MINGWQGIVATYRERDELRAEVRRLREERTRLLDEAAKIVEVRGKALASGDRYFSRLAVHALLDKLAADIRAAVRGEV